MNNGAPQIDSNDFSDTSGSLARDSGASVPLVVRYARLGLLDFRVAANGIRLFRKGQADKVREIRRQRLMNRGNR